MHLTPAYMHLNPPYRPFLRSSDNQSFIIIRGRLLRLCSDILMTQTLDYHLLSEMYLVVYGSLPSFPLISPDGRLIPDWNYLVNVTALFASQSSPPFKENLLEIATFDSDEINPVNAPLVKPFKDDFSIDLIPKWLRHAVFSGIPQSISNISTHIALRRKLLAPFEDVLYIPVQQYLDIYILKFGEFMFWEGKGKPMEFV